MPYEFDSVVDRLNTRSLKWDALEKIYGKKDLLPLWVADMDFKSPPQVAAALKKRAEHGVFGYAGNYDGYYQATADWMKKRFDWQVGTDSILPTPGVIPALNMLVRTFASPGDNVILQPPVYPPFFKAARNSGCHVVDNPLLWQKGRYVMDFDDLAGKINNRTRILILCSPHNPVGRVWAEDELQRLSEICRDNNVLIISDEIHADLVYKGKKHLPLPMSSLSEHVVVLTAPSKTFNLAGLQTANAIIPDPRLKQLFKITLENYGFSRPNIFGLEALEAAYRYGEPWLEELLQYLEENLAFLQEYIKEKICPLEVVPPEGTYLAWVDCRGLGMSGLELEKFMVYRAGLAVNQGYTFGMGGEGFIRINLACPRKILMDAMNRLEKAVSLKAGG